MRSFQARNPATGEPVGGHFHDATEAQIGAAASAANEAFPRLRSWSGTERGALLEAIAGEIEALGDGLVQVAHQESGLPLPRLTGERARTCGQLRLFAQLVREGSWVDARIDLALPQRTPLPRPDLRRYLTALGPVAVFGASNFPLAFSVAGGDTASAFAAGCPVVVKAHPAHPGTSELVAGAIARAVKAQRLPAGVFAIVQGRAETALALVRHPAICAAGFTGSHAAGRALFDAAAARPRPIPVFSEMSSVNPLLILPGALTERASAIAEGLAGSITLGVGQFCTKPGLIFLAAGPAANAFTSQFAERVEKIAPAVMLTVGICERFASERSKVASSDGVHDLWPASLGPAGSPNSAAAAPSIAVTSGENFRRRPELAHEVFGPFCLVIRCASDDELAACLESLDGQLTATIHAGAQEIEAARPWVSLLERKAGRVILNGFPTGVEVSPAMNHGGPYPATTDSRFTSVGTAAIQRFARPICYQSLPQPLLPAELRDENPLGILRLVNGAPSRDSLR